MKMELLGTTNILRRLQSLDERMQGPILRRAIGRACKPIETRARASAPTETGLLRVSLGHKVKVYKRNNRLGSTSPGFRPKGTVVAIIGPRVTFKSARARKLQGRAAQRKPAFYAHLVERGTAPHSVRTRVDMKRIRRGLTPWNDAFPANHKAARRAAVRFFFARDRAKGFRTHPGAKAKPFLGPAANASKPQVMAVMISELRSAISAA